MTRTWMLKTWGAIGLVLVLGCTTDYEYDDI
jgi:hypothetical protein